MKKAILNLMLRNLQIFCISILVLFFIGTSLGLASHDARRNLFLGIYTCFVVLHVLFNVYFIHRLRSYSPSYSIATSIIILLLYVLLLIPFI